MLTKGSYLAKNIQKYAYVTDELPLRVKLVKKIWNNTSFLLADNANGFALALNKTSVITLGVVLLYSQLLDKRLVGLSKEETLCGKRKRMWYQD